MYILKIQQQPKQARMCGSGHKVDRRSIDPPPIILLRRQNNEQELITHNLFMFACLIGEDSDAEQQDFSQFLTGSTVSSLFHVRDQNCFVFPDLSVRVEGKWRFKLKLYEITDDQILFKDSVITDVFTVYSSKKFPGMDQSTEISKEFANQGLRLRIRRNHAETKPAPKKRAIEDDSAHTSSKKHKDIRPMTVGQVVANIKPNSQASAPTPAPSGAAAPPTASVQLPSIMNISSLVHAAEMSSAGVPVSGTPATGAPATSAPAPVQPIPAHFYGQPYYPQLYAPPHMPQHAPQPIQGAGGAQTHAPGQQQHVTPHATPHASPHPQHPSQQQSPHTPHGAHAASQPMPQQMIPQHMGHPPPMYYAPQPGYYNYSQPMIPYAYYQGSVPAGSQPMPMAGPPGPPTASPNGAAAPYYYYPGQPQAYK